MKSFLESAGIALVIVAICPAPSGCIYLQGKADADKLLAQAAMKAAERCAPNAGGRP